MSKAIEDYTQAIQLESTLAKARFNRGFLQSKCVGKTSDSGRNLRMAAKCYFDQGDMKTEQSCKRLSEQVHEHIERQPAAADKQLVVANLFA